VTLCPREPPVRFYLALRGIPTPLALSDLIDPEITQYFFECNDRLARSLPSDIDPATIVKICV